MVLSSKMLLALGALAYFLLKKPANAAASTPAVEPVRTRARPPAPKAKPGVVTVPEVVVTPRVAPVPAQLPWPSQSTQAQRNAETEVLNRPMTQSTKKDAVPAFNVHREDGSAPQNESSALIVRERNPFEKSYWMPAKKATHDEQQKAKSFLDLGMWKKGGIWYDGDRTFAARRQYRATMHGAKKAVEMWVPKPPFR